MTNKEFIESITLEGEEWRDVVGWEGYYMVSSFGRVVSLSRTITEKTGKTYVKRHLLMKPTANHCGGILYYQVSLCSNGIRKVSFVHRLVALAFISNHNNRTEIDHIDANGLNNNVLNLRWCNHSENNMNPISRQRQSDSHNGKILFAKRKKIVRMQDGKPCKIYDSLSEAENDGFKHSCVSRCCNGSRSHYKGYNWMYLSDYETLVSKSKND